MHCPQFSGCATRLKGDYCPDTGRAEFSQLIDSDGHFDPAYFNRVKLCSEVVMQCVEKLAEHKFGGERATELPVPTDLIQQAGEEHPVEIRNVDLRACGYLAYARWMGDTGIGYRPPTPKTGCAVP